MERSGLLKVLIAVLVIAGAVNSAYGQTFTRQPQPEAMPFSRPSFQKVYYSEVFRPAWTSMSPEAAAQVISSRLSESQDNASGIAGVMGRMNTEKAAAILKLCDPFQAGLILSNKQMNEGSAKKLLYATSDLQKTPESFSNLLNYMAWRNPQRVARLINGMTPADAAAAMSNFHPETVSFTLKYVSTGKAAYILSNLDPAKAAYAFGMVDFVSQDRKFSSFTSAQLAAIVVKMDPAKAAGIVANERLSVEDSVTIIGAVKERNEPAAQNILAELGKLDAAKATQIRDALGMHILSTSVADFDLDGSGQFDFQDVKYLFNNMETISVDKADFNHNGRIDFSDIVLMNNKLQEVNNTFSLTAGTGGLEYRLSSDGKSVTTVAVGMGLHTSPLTMDYSTGTISYIPYPNSWDDESKRISVTKAGDPAQYAELSTRMITSIQTVLTRYGSTLTDQQKTQLNSALEMIRQHV